MLAEAEQTEQAAALLFAGVIQRRFGRRGAQRRFGAALAGQARRRAGHGVGAVGVGHLGLLVAHVVRRCGARQRRRRRWRRWRTRRCRLLVTTRLVPLPDVAQWHVNENHFCYLVVAECGAQLEPLVLVHCFKIFK